MPLSSIDRTTSAPDDSSGAYPYGWRYRERSLPDGSVVIEQEPLTYEDILHPQEGDQVTHSDLHQRICVYLYNVFRGLLTAIPSAAVLHDVRVAWDVPELKPHAPDIAVIFDIRQPKNWSTFDVAEEGVRPTLIVEVTSPETRSIDLTTKLEEYDLAGVPLYIIIDLVQRHGQIVPRLLGYRQTPSVYAVVAPNDRGWIWLEPLQIWLGINEQTIVCYDASSTPIDDYADLRTALDTATAARASAELRVKELEDELRRLRGEAR